METKASTSATKPNWVRRHPCTTAAIVILAVAVSLGICFAFPPSRSSLCHFFSKKIPHAYQTSITVRVLTGGIGGVAIVIAITALLCRKKQSPMPRRRPQQAPESLREHPTEKIISALKVKAVHCSDESLRILLGRNDVKWDTVPEEHRKRAKQLMDAHTSESRRNALA